MPTFPPPTLTSKWSSSKHFVKPLLGKYYWNPERGHLSVCAAWHAGIGTVVTGCPWSLFPQVPFHSLPSTKILLILQNSAPMLSLHLSTKIKPSSTTPFCLYGLIYLLCSAWYPSCDTVLCPNFKEKILQKRAFVSLTPKPSGCGWHVALYRAG